jgi:hypothetical protein
MKKICYIVFFVANCFSSLFSTAFAENVAAESVAAAENNIAPALPFQSGETLHYKLSYRGLITSMIWADLADARMTFFADQNTRDNQPSHQFVLALTTENYNKAEMIQPVRYTYVSSLDKTLARTLAVEEIDKGKNQSHDYLWLDWTNKETQLYKKREKKESSAGFFETETIVEWEEDGIIDIPYFLQQFPLLENQYSYFIHKESGDKIQQSQVIDPLSLIYRLRMLEPEQEINRIALVVSDDIRHYRVEPQGKEMLSIKSKTHQAFKYKIHTDEKKQRFFFVWLSNDNQRIPLKLAMDAPLGKLEIELVKVTQDSAFDKEKLSLSHDVPDSNT